MNHIDTSANALIVGAGVAGLTATAVLRERGWTVHVVERAPGLRTGGYKVDVRGAGVEVLRRLGVLERARDLACHVRGGSVVSADGTTVAAMGGDTFGGRSREDVEIERGDLLELLATAAGAVDFETEPVAITPADGGAQVTFSDGRVASYDVVLGADGLHSGVRRMAVAPARAAGEDPWLRSLGHAIAVVTMPTSMGLTAEETTYASVGRTALLYATATRPRARAMLLFTHDGPLPSGRGDQVAFLRSRFAGEGWRLPEILAALDDADDIYLDSVAQVVCDRWSSGAVGLIGDAAACASPASGQGTTLGLVTAYVTATELAAAPGDAAGALRRAEASLRPFVERNQALGPANLKRMVLPTPRAVRSTMVALRVMNALPFTDLLLGTVARRLARASAYELPTDR